jgi:glycosyltransferase involved in cell wall biosynthesis
LETDRILLSIVVPFYNVDKFIVQCLDSLFAQDISLDDYEVICVNDCSTDKSRDIVIEYQSKYSNLVLIDHEINTKVGSARNTGLKAVRGRYVWFIDSDDTIKSNCLNYLLSICVENKLDVIAFNISTVTSNGELISNEKVFVEKLTVTSGKDFLNNTFGESIIYHLGYPYRGIISRNLLLTINASFPVGISYGEETIFMARCILFSERVMSLSDSFYFYRQNSLSVTSNLEKDYRGDLLFQSIFNAGNYVMDLIQECETLDKHLASNILRGMPWFVNRLFVRLLRTSIKQRFIYYKEIRLKKELVFRLLPFTNRPNYIISKYPILGFFIISVIAPIYIIRKKVS